MLQQGKRFFTSESVTEGHPDKVCDQISDAILDAHLAQDPMARVACETIAAPNLVLVMGEITSKADVDYETIIRKTIADIGYRDGACGFDAATCRVMLELNQQPPAVARGRAEGKMDIGAGDQGMMFGFACDETEEFMPMPIALAHRLTRRLSEVRKSGELPYLRPDGKSQVTVEYVDGKPVRVDAIVLSTQHSADADQQTIRRDLIERVVRPTIPASLLDGETKYFINPTGRFVVGGPEGDSGLTGRKIIVDTYGGYAPHGGGAFSGKDPTKVDRSACYMVRYIAKNIVAAGLASRCEIEIAYAIGVAHPVSILVDTFGTGKLADEALEAIVRRVFDLRPAAIIEKLGLRQPMYRQTAAYGHFGRTDVDLPWERTDMAEALRAAAGK